MLEALDLMVGGVQNLVVPVPRESSRLRKHLMGSNKPVLGARSNSLDSAHFPPSPMSHNGQEYCWLTQEDMLRFLLGSLEADMAGLVRAAKLFSLLFLQ